MGVGFTVIVNVLARPVHVTPVLTNCGITVIVATTGAVPTFTAVNAKIFPVPFAPKPIEVVLFVHV